VIATVPRHIARKYRVVPVFKHENSLTVAIADPSDLDTMDSLQHLVNAEVDFRWRPIPISSGPLGKYYGDRGGGMAADPRLKEAIEELTREHVQIQPAADGAVVEADAPLIKLVNSLIVEAFKLRASDIHLEPLAKKFRVRYRIDGVLHEMKARPSGCSRPSSAV
jgi:type IV pilus assembly protein PilB